MKQRRLWSDAVSYADIAELFFEPGAKLSRRDVAERLGLSKSNGLNAKLEQLVADGVLRRTESRLINGAPMFLYERA